VVVDQSAPAISGQARTNLDYITDLTIRAIAAGSRSGRRRASTWLISGCSRRRGCVDADAGVLSGATLAKHVRLGTPGTA
jgi:hypothetical protein